MTDDLRDRIANTLYQELSIELPATIRGADAVIRELCLHREDMNEWAVLANGFRGHRYVTHWEENNE